jgi:glycosyltransferase involved in cell wall biosynthesis
MSNSFANLRVALVHYWLVTHRGGERVLEALAEMFPGADIFALVVDQASLSPALRSHKITPSFLQKIPGAKKHYRKLLPLFPLAIEQFNLDDYDLVISQESGPAKGVLTSQHTCHVCYCNSPMRYLWDMYHQYRARDSFGAFSRAFFSMSAHYVRIWDFATAARVDYFVADSRNVASRIRKHYRRDSTVIYPPVNTSAGFIITSGIGDYYLVVSQFVPYKRIDLAIEACARLGRKLRIVGDGEEYRRLRRLAGPTIEFLGSLPDDELRKLYAACRALLFPGEEDFGIVPVEAQSCGRPVIAYGRGGALETVCGANPGETVIPERHTGVFFREQTVDSLVEAIRWFESVEDRFSPEAIRARSLRFDVSRFKGEIAAFIAEKWAEFTEGHGVVGPPPIGFRVEQKRALG